MGVKYPWRLDGAANARDPSAMPFLLMIFLTLVCLPELRDWPAPLGAGWLSETAINPLVWAVGWTAAAVTLVAWRARRVTQALTRGLERDPAAREQILRRYERGRFRTHLLLFALYTLCLVVLGWGWAVGQFWVGAPGPDDVSPPRPGTELLLLAPFVLAQLLCWAAFYDADRALHPPPTDSAGGRRGAGFGSRAAYVIFQARQKLALVFLPVLLLVVQKDLVRLLPDLWKRWEAAANLAGCAMLLVVFITLPWVVRLMLGLRPLPDGPLRRRLMASAHRLRFRCSNLLLWNTRSGMANAMVIGLLPWIRYVVFTDRLVDEFSADEVEAVFGHEAGHVRHQHMLYYLGFLLMSVAVLGGLINLAGFYLQAQTAEGVVSEGSLLAWLGETLPLEGHGYLAVVPLVGLLLSYILVVFGFLSRRCERQADIFGCKAVSCDRADCPGHDADAPLTSRPALCPTGIRTFIRALEKVALVNGISRERPGFLQSWQHSTIARRVEFLQRLLADPSAEGRFQRRVALVKWVLLVSLGAALLVLVQTNAL
jgi:Zn-dependent protease with chaperone function